MVLNFLCSVKRHCVGIFSPSLIHAFHRCPCLSWSQMGCFVPLHTTGNGLLCNARRPFCLLRPLLLHADSTTSALPITNIIFLLEVRNEHVVCRLQVSEKVLVDGCPFGNCCMWCAGVRKLNLISQAETFPVLNSSWVNYFTLAFTCHPMPTI